MALSNLLLLINLGCEMLFIIDQRLMAQNIAKDKSAQGELKHKQNSFTIFDLSKLNLSCSGSDGSTLVTSVFSLHQLNIHGRADYDRPSPNNSFRHRFLFSDAP